MNIISVDLGGTNTRIARFIDADQVKMIGSLKRPNTHVYAEDLAYIVETAKSLSGDLPIDALGIGVPGRVNDKKTDMVASNNLPEWANRGFCSDLSRALECSVYMDNDGIAAGLGEGYFSNVTSNFHYLIWGTGISAVDVEYIGKEKVKATYLRANHRTHFEAWENDCGGAAILRKYGKPGEQLTTDEWADINTLFARYLREYIAIAQPPAIIFGGGLAIHHAETIMSYADEISVPMRITQFGEDSGLIGGLALVRQGVITASISTSSNRSHKTTKSEKI